MSDQDRNTAEQTAISNEFAGVKRTILERSSHPDGERELVLAEVVYAPGVEAPAHRHPVGGLVYILEGTAESAYGNDPTIRHQAGDAVHDRADAVHTVFRNVDQNHQLRFLTFYVLEPGQTYTEPV